MSWTPPDWMMRFPVTAWIVDTFVGIGNLIDRITGWFWREVEREEKKVLVIGIVGDLSMRDLNNFDKALGAACKESDIVVQVGDINPAYDILKRWKVWCKANGKDEYAIPGNHDYDQGSWDKYLGSEWRKTWYVVHDLCYLIGLDNAADKFEPSTWSLLQSVPVDGKPLFVFCHKPTRRVVLPSGVESGHIMGEGNLPNADADRLESVLKVMSQTRDILLIHGHYHDFSDQQMGGLRRIIDGRGGAGGSGPGELGWTRIIVTPEGFVPMRVNL